ncbi:hypothetical protein AQF98_01030 [Pedobacter sp. Hv1]|nr:hypothetical protein AQF98_01030 [Pedobacter sp. Hv1]
MNRPLYLSYGLFLLVTFSLNTKLFAQPVQKKVVMISIDGTPDYLIDKFLRNGVLPANGAFAKMKKYGAYAETMLPINVGSTGPSHTSIFTGATPAQTGIVGNSFRNANQSKNSPALSAFRQPVAAETIFQAAMRQGKKVMALGGVGLDDSDIKRKTDYLYMYPNISGPSLVLDLNSTDTVLKGQNNKVFRKLKTDLKSPSKPIFEVAGGLKIPLHIYLTDSINSGTNTLSPLPQIIVDTDADLNNGYAAAVVPDQWTVIALVKNGKQYNVSFKILKKDVAAGKYRLFMSAPAEIFGYPSSFLQKIQSAIGFWPGEPENRKQTTGLISEEIWFEQIDRLAKYYRDLIITGMKTENWDLLFGYFSTLDDVQHRYTLTDPRQIDYTAENGKRPARYAGYIEKWFQTIDRYLLEIMDAAPPETNFVIFSDHGMIPIHTNLLINNYLEKQGFNVSKSELEGISSGTSAHIYINKEKIGVQSLPSYIKRLSQSLQLLKDSVTGEPIFEIVANQQEQKRLGLYHKDYSGDLFVSCKVGYAISDRYLPDVNYLVQNSFDPAMFAHQNQATKNFLLNGTMNETGRAVHGSLSSIREGQSIFYAIGPNVPTRKLKSVLSIQIASTVSKLLGIAPPKDTKEKSAF